MFERGEKLQKLLTVVVTWAALLSFSSLPTGIS